MTSTIHQDVQLLMPFTALSIINFACAVDQTILGIALSTITQDLRGASAQALWTGTSFMLSSAVVQPSWTVLSRVFGLKKCLILAILAFGGGSIVCACSRDFPTLIAGRTLQGAGAGGVAVFTYLVVDKLVTLQQRTRWFGFVTISWILGTVSGPLIGGVCAQPGRWRAIFWMNLPFCGTSIALILYFIESRSLDSPNRPRLLELRRLDWAGLIWLTAGLVSILLSLTWGGTTYTWRSVHVLLPLIVGIVSLLVFACRSHWGQSLPLFSSRIMTRTAGASFVGTVVHGMILSGILYFETMYFMIAKSLTPMGSAVAQLTYIGTVGPFAVIAGLIIGRTDRYRSLLIWSWLITILGVALMTTFEEETPTWQWVVISGTCGTGLGGLFSAMNYAIQASAQQHGDRSSAAALFSFLRSLGLMCGVSLIGVVFQNLLTARLKNSTLISASDAAYVGKNTMALADALRHFEVSKWKDEIVHAYVLGLKVSWWFMTCLSVMAGLLAYTLTEDFSLNPVESADETGHVESHVTILLPHIPEPEPSACSPMHGGQLIIGDDLCNTWNGIRSKTSYDMLSSPVDSFQSTSTAATATAAAEHQLRKA